MSEKFRNRFRIPSCRLPGWDYARPGAYFITINTQGREPFFGYIDRYEMHPSDAGKLAVDLWATIPAQFPGIHLDEYMIMPDHMHGILVIPHHKRCDEFPNDAPAPHDDPTTNFKKHKQSNPSRRGGFAGNRNSMLYQNISRVIRWYKGRCCFEIRKICPAFSWQTRFYDRVIRNPSEWNSIRKYIRENPIHY